MASPAQILANQTNAALSTGPVTEQGKKTSAQNSTRHGLTSRIVVIKGESQGEFDEFRAGLLADYKPKGTGEEAFAEEVIANAWRLKRAHRIEAETFDLYVEEDGDLAKAFHKHAKEFDRVRRYIVSIERAFHRALQSLGKVQMERIKRTREREMMEALEAETELIPEQQIGFVSQNTEPKANNIEFRSEPRPHTGLMPHYLTFMAA
jgi:hypothetical protein